MTGQRGSFFSEVTISFQHSFKTNVTFVVFNVVLLNMMVSQLLVELPRTLKGQNGVEFDFQSIYIHTSSLRRENGGLLGLFRKLLVFLKNKIFFKVMSTCGCTVRGGGRQCHFWTMSKSKRIFSRDDFPYQQCSSIIQNVL